MKPPNIGAKLLKRFDNSADEPLRIRRHLGWEDRDGTPHNLGFAEEAFPGPYYFGPAPPNTTFSPESLGDMTGDVRVLWAMPPIGAGVRGDPPFAREPDEFVRLNTGEVWRVERKLDVASSQSGLNGAALALAR